MTRRTAIVAAVLGLVAVSGCGSRGGAGGTAHLAVQAAVRHGVCVPVHPALAPYRGRLTLVRSGGGRLRLATDSRGRVGAAVSPGAYRMLPPFRGSTVTLELDGRAVAVAGRRYPLRIGWGERARLDVVIMPRRGECAATGAGT